MGTDRRRTSRTVVAGAVGIASLAIAAAEPAAAEPVAGFEVAELVKDFETAPQGTEWQSDDAVVVGEYVFLFQETPFDDPDSVRLWEYHVPSEALRTVDISAFFDIEDTGVAASTGELVFGAERDDGAGGTERVLAKLTPGGVPVVVSVVPGRVGGLAAGSATVYFSIDTEALWASGLTGGTTMEVAGGLSRLVDLAPAPRGDGTEVVYFEADGANGQEPHRYDPGVGVTEFDIATGSTDSVPGDFYVIDNAVYFEAFLAGDRNLYRLEGADPALAEPELLKANVHDLVVSGRRLFVSFEDGAADPLAYFDHDGDAFVAVVADFPVVRDGFELGPSGALLNVEPGPGESAVWYTDGTALGTVEVSNGDPIERLSRDLRGGPDAGGAAALFFGDDGTGDRIWRYEPVAGLSSIDPSAFGTTSYSEDPQFFASAQADHWIFPAFDDAAGFEAFGSGGTTATTAPIGDLQPGTLGSFPTRLAPNGTGADLLIAAGSSGNQKIVTLDVDAVPTDIVLGLNGDDDLVAFSRETDGSYLLLLSRSGEEWLVRSANGVATDLVSLGTDGPSDFVRSGDRVFFERSSTPRDRVASVKTDGTDLQELGEIGFEHATAFAGGVVFRSAGSVAGEEEPWFSDGTVAGTFPLGDLRASRGSFPGPFFELDGLLFFHATIATWSTDGTEAGTVSAWASLGINELGAIGDDGILARDGSDLFFVTSAAGDVTDIEEPDFPNAPALEFWQEESATSHAVSAALDDDVTWIGVVDSGEYRAVEYDVGDGGEIVAAVAHRGVAFFVVNRNGNSNEIVRTDGTPGGTAIVWNQRAQPEEIYELALIGDRVFFDGFTGEHGKELWSFDLRPLAPTSVSAAAGDGLASVSWVAPTDAADWPVSGYAVTASPGAATCTTTGATTCVIPGLTNGTSYTFTVTRSSESSTSKPSVPSALATPSAPTPPEPEPTVAEIVSLDPGRVLDTRANGETVDDLFEKVGKADAGDTIELQVLGRAGVPSSGVGSVVLNVTMIQPEGGGFVSIFPCGDLPNASSMNAPNGGGVVANEVVAKVSATGTVCLFTSVATHLAADATGYVPESSGVTSLDPGRVLDTRASGETVDDVSEKIGKADAGDTIELQVLGRAGVPASGVGSVVLNVTMIQPEGGGFVSIFPCGDVPNASSMNAPNSGGVVANEVIAKVSPTGTVCLFTSVATHLAADVTGYVPTGSGVSSLDPGRVLDTRANGETVDDVSEKIGKADAGETIELQVLGRAGVPSSGVGSVVLNVTMIQPEGGGFVSIFPCGDLPNASSMNAPNGGGVVANEVIAKVSPTGTVCLFTSVATHLAADVTGYITAA